MTRIRFTVLFKYCFAAALTLIPITGKAIEIDISGNDAGLAAFKTEDGRYGFIDRSSGKTAIPPYGTSKISDVPKFSDGLLVAKLNSKTIVLDQNGNVLFAVDYSQVGDFNEGLALVRESNFKYGYIDKTGKIAVLPQFDEASDFHEGLAAVSINGKYGYIDATGKTAISPKFEIATNFQEGLALVRIDGKWGAINKAGEIAVPPTFYKFDFDSKGFREGLLAFKSEAGLYGLIDKSGTTIVEPQFESISSFNNGVARAKKNRKYFFIDTTGKKIGDLEFDLAWQFNDDLAKVKINDKYGFIDQTINLVIPAKYESTSWFYDGMAIFRANGKFGYLRKNGEIAIKPQFDNAGVFYNGSALVEQNGKLGLIDKNGSWKYEVTMAQIGSEPINSDHEEKARAVIAHAGELKEAEHYQALKQDLMKAKTGDEISEVLIALRAMSGKYKADPDGLLIKANAMLEKVSQAEKEHQEKELQAEKNQRAKELLTFRNKLEQGDETNCGLVIEKNEKIAKIQLKSTNEERWLKLEEIYPAGSECSVVGNNPNSTSAAQTQIQQNTCPPITDRLQMVYRANIFDELEEGCVRGRGRASRGGSKIACKMNNGPLLVYYFDRSSDCAHRLVEQNAWTGTETVIKTYKVFDRNSSAR